MQASGPDFHSHLESTEKQASVQSCASGGGGWVLGGGTWGHPKPFAVIRNKVTKQTGGLVASIFRVPWQSVSLIFLSYKADYRVKFKDSLQGHLVYETYTLWFQTPCTQLTKFVPPRDTLSFAAEFLAKAWNPLA